MAAPALKAARQAGLLYHPPSKGTQELVAPVAAVLAYLDLQIIQCLRQEDQQVCLPAPQAAAMVPAVAEMVLVATAAAAHLVALAAVVQTEQCV